MLARGFQEEYGPPFSQGSVSSHLGGHPRRGRADPREGRLFIERERRFVVCLLLHVYWQDARLKLEGFGVMMMFMTLGCRWSLDVPLTAVKREIQRPKLDSSGQSLPVPGDGACQLVMELERPGTRATRRQYHHHLCHQPRCFQAETRPNA